MSIFRRIFSSARSAGAFILVMGAILAGPLSSASHAVQITMYGAKSPGSGADAGDIVTINQNDNNQSVTVGNPGIPGGITGIDFDNDGNLWGSTLNGLGSSSNLINIDPNTGALVSNVGPIHTNASDIGGSAISIGDLAYNPLNNTLYGIQSLDRTPSEGGNIFTIDLGTGLASFVGPTIWGTTAGIAFDSAGTLYALGWDPDVGPFGANMLFTLDSGDATELSRVEVSKNDFIFSGLGIHPVTGEIFATEDDFFATGTGTGNIYSVNPATGEMTFAGKPAGVVSDIAFRVSEPGVLATMLLGMLIICACRRTRPIMA